jgi:RNA polymerase sigma-70 factor (ECF subfamily)
LTVTNPAREASAGDETLAVAAQNDDAAFDILYRRYVTRVYVYCYTRTDNAQTAEDLTAQTFVAALEGIARFRGEGSFASWLFGIASNKCKAYHRHHQRRPTEPLEKAIHVPDADRSSLDLQTYEQSILDCAQSVLPQLSEDRQEVIRLRFLAGLNTAETAEIMGRRRGAVRTLLSRAIDDLRERCLDEK